MKHRIFGIVGLLAVRIAGAGDAQLFEVHSVEDAPTPTTKEYSLPEHNGESEKLLLDNAVLLDGTALKAARAERDQNGNSCIAVYLTDSGMKRFDKLTEKFVLKRLGIVVAGQLMIAPTISAASYGARSIQITGKFTEQEATDLAARLNGKSSK